MPSPLIRNMIETYQYPLLDRDSLAEYVAGHKDVVLFFAENPKHFPECDDVAVILPEIIKHLGRPLQVVVIDQQCVRDLHKAYGLTAWPALVFLRNGEYLGTITRVQEWSEYLLQINRILDSHPMLTVDTALTRTAASEQGCNTCQTIQNGEQYD